MFRSNVKPSQWIAALVIALACSLVVPAYAAPAGAPAPQKEKKGKKKKKVKNPNAPQTTGTPALWEDPGDISSLDLFWGAGSPEDAPKAPFKFVKEDTSGTNPKIRVTDANGNVWNVKFDEEVHAEIAASRIAWAMGYKVEESYFVPSGVIEGVSGLGRAKKFVGANGAFNGAMFEARPDDHARRAQPWSWDSNPFVGTEELSGLAILAVMLNNWDAKVDNNNVIGMFEEDGSVKEWYLVADWGGTFGKMGGAFSHSKWDLDAYEKQAFVDGVSGGKLKLNYSGKGGRIMSAVPLEHARWFAGRVSQLSQEQIKQAFRAAGASNGEVEGFSSKVLQKIGQLTAAVR